MAKLSKPPLLQRIIQEGLNYPVSVWSQWFTNVENSIATQWYTSKVVGNQTVDSIIFDNIPTDINYLELSLKFVKSTINNEELRILFSTDGGKNFVEDCKTRIISESVNQGYAGASKTADYVLATQESVTTPGNDDEGGICGTIKIYNSDGDSHSQVIIDTSVLPSQFTSTNAARYTGAAVIPTTEPINYIKLQFGLSPSSTPIDKGTVALYGRRDR